MSGQSVVVDLGCGKGGVSIAIAASLGCQVVGVDLFEPFIDIARGAAEAALAARHPDLALAFEDFARAQQDAYAYLAADAMGGAVWALRRR